MYERFRRLTFDIMARLILGVDGGADLDRLSRLNDRLAKGTTALLRVGWPWTTYGRGLRARAELCAYLRGVIRARRGVPGSDALGLLLAARDEAGAALSEEELLAGVVRQPCPREKRGALRARARYVNWLAVPPAARTAARIAAPADERECAARLGCSLEAVRLARRAEIVDLHVDTFIPVRLWRYDIMTRHRGALLGRRFFGHLDLPRLVDGGLAAAMWSITTNPFRSAAARWRVFRENLATLRGLIARSGGHLVEVRDARQYQAARAAGAHACLLAIQGANAVEAAPDGVASIPDDCVVRATLVHLTNSVYGATSSPLGLRRDKRLTAAGRDLIAQLNARRVFVDLAHVHERTFHDAVAVHDRTQPLLVTHTGVAGVTPHWRNLSDAQIKAIADTGGTIGIIFSEQFLRRPGGPADSAMVVEHIEHVIRVAGDDFVSLGSDYDGAITPPPDLAGADCYPRLVQRMLDRGFSEERIRKVLGGNFRRAFAALRPGG